MMDVNRYNMPCLLFVLQKGQDVPPIAVEPDQSGVETSVFSTKKGLFHEKLNKS